jgi:general secretion pathway protein M
MEELKETIKGWIADAQAQLARLTERERRLVAITAAAFGVFIFFIVLVTFSTTANGYRKRTAEKMVKLEKIQTLAASYRDAQAERSEVEQQLTRGGELRLMSYVQERGDAAGLEIPTLNPKGDVPLGEDGKIIESAVEVTMTDIQLNRLLTFLQSVEQGPGIIKVKYLRLEPRVASETLTAWTTVASYKLKQ